MFSFTFPLLTVSSGALLFGLFRPGGRALSFRGIVEVAILSLLVPSVLGLALLRNEVFIREKIVLALAVVNLLLLGLWVVVRRRSPGPRRAERSISVVAMVVVLGVAAFFRFPGINFVRGGQDQGVYVNIANALAETGTYRLRDPLAGFFADRSTVLAKHYTRPIHRARKCKTLDSCRGAFLPGFFLRSVVPSVIIPQFYHLHPIWLGYSHLTLSGAMTTAILPLFGVLSVALFSLIIRGWTRYRSSAVCGALLLACSPGHAYFSRFPVSEITAGVFFLGAIYFFQESRLKSLPALVLGAVFSGLLFFTHITGFLFLFVLFPALLFAAWRFRSWTPAVGWSLSLVLFFMSVSHGLVFSGPYSRGSWRKLGVPETVLTHLLERPILWTEITLVLSLLPFLVVIHIERIRTGLRAWAPSKVFLQRLGIVMLLMLVGYLASRAWLLGFTDHYATNRWIGRRWKLAGRGFESVKHLKVYALALFVSPIILVSAGMGWVRLCRQSLLSARTLLLVLCGALFSVALLAMYFTAAYLFFFGRYIVPILVPLTILFGMIGLEAIRFKRRGLANLVRGGLVCLAVAYMAPMTWAQARSNEGGALYSQLQQIARQVGPKGMLFIDTAGFARVELVTPLRISFGVPVVTYSRGKLTGDELQALMKEASGMGYSVYLLSGKDRGVTVPFLKPVGAFRLFLGSLVPKRGEVLPTLFRRGSRQVFLHRFNGSHG